MVLEVHPIFFYGDGVAGVGDMIEIDSDGVTFVTEFPRSVCELRA